MNKKSQIYEFNPQVYPFRLWVCINPSLEDLQDKYYALTDNMERTDFTPDTWNRDTFCIATCIPVSDKESGWVGILCSIFRKDKMSVGVTAHEASHISDFISDSFGVGGFSFDDGEARAYIVQWAADCIWKVKSGKLKN
jgi:hypothetical protein